MHRSVLPFSRTGSCWSNVFAVAHHSGVCRCLNSVAAWLVAHIGDYARFPYCGILVRHVGMLLEGCQWSAVVVVSFSDSGLLQCPGFYGFLWYWVCLDWQVDQHFTSK